MIKSVQDPMCGIGQAGLAGRMQCHALHVRDCVRCDPRSLKKRRPSPFSTNSTRLLRCGVNPTPCAWHFLDIHKNLSPDLACRSFPKNILVVRPFFSSQYTELISLIRACELGTPLRIIAKHSMRPGTSSAWEYVFQDLGISAPLNLQLVDDLFLIAKLRSQVLQRYSRPLPCHVPFVGIDQSELDIFLDLLGLCSATQSMNILPTTPIGGALPSRMAAAPDQTPAREAATDVLATLLSTPATNTAATGGHGSDL